MNRRKLLKAAPTLFLAAPIIAAKPKGKPEFEYIEISGRETKCRMLVPQTLIKNNDAKSMLVFYNQAVRMAIARRKNPKEILVVTASFPFSKEFVKVIYEKGIPLSSTNHPTNPS